MLRKNTIFIRHFSKSRSQTKAKILKDRPDSTQELNEKMKATMGSQENYTPYQDKRLWSVGKDLMLYGMVIVISGFATKKAVEYFVSPGASEISQQNFQKKMMMGKEVRGEGIYKSQHEISSEFNSLKHLTPQQLANPAFFSKDKTFFLQIIPEEFYGDGEMHPHYYWIKKAMRQQKRQHVFPYAIKAQDFKNDIEVLQKVFNVQSYEELNDLFYIVVNQDRMKLPIGGRLSGASDVSSAIPIKFCVNPIKIDSEDDLFEIFEINKGQPTKYFAIINDGKFKNPTEMSLNQKLFRKFFYENSSFIESETVFFEISSPKIAAQIGMSPDKIYAIQNSNIYSDFDQKFITRKFLSLDLQILQMPDLDLKQFEIQFVKEGGSNTQNFTQWILTKSEIMDEVFQQVSQFIEKVMIPQKIYVQTNSMLKFYRRYFKQKQQNLLFVAAKSEQFEELNLELNNIKDVQILITDIKNAPSSFNLIQDEGESTVRYFDFSQVYDDVTKKTYKIEEIENYDLDLKDVERQAHFFTLKYKPNDLKLANFIEDCNMGKFKPYLESSQEDLTLLNYQQFLDKQRFSVIEIFANQCAGCKQVEPLLSEIENRIGCPVGKMDILNETAFLADVENTPSFLIYDGKKKKFANVDLRGEDSEEELVEILSRRIAEKINQMK